MGINFSNIVSKHERDSTKSPQNDRSWFNRDLQVFSPKTFSDKRKEKFFSEIGILLTSGLDLNSSLNLIIEQEPNKDVRYVYTTIHQNLLKGKGISNSLSVTNKFSEYDLYSIKMGENGGFLGEVFIELSNYYAKRIKYKRKLYSAISYPLLVLFSAVITLFFMLNYLVPAFAEVFKQSNNDLPYVTQIIISISKVSGKVFIYLSFLFLILLWIYVTNKKKIWLRRLLSSMILKTPFIGSIVRLIYLDRFFISMVLLSKSKVSLVESINLSRLMISFYPFEVALLKIENDIVKGKTLSDSMKGFSLLFDAKIITMVKVGEEVNQLSSVFEKLSNLYSTDLDYSVNNISTFLEPILILFVGLIVATILIAMYLPIFQMGGNIQ